MDKIEKNLLEQVAGLHEVPAGAYNIRSNGKMAGRNTTANIVLQKKTGRELILELNLERKKKAFIFRLY